MMATLARLFAMVVALALCAAAAVFVYVALGEGPSTARLIPSGWGSSVSDSPRRETYTVRPGMSAAEIGDELEKRGLIRSSLAFRWEIESRGVGSKIGAGTYELSPSMPTGEIVSVLARGAVASGKAITIVEGWRAEQTAQRVDEQKLGVADDFLRLVRAPREAGLVPPDSAAASLEGYLFPDTYEFDQRSTSTDVIKAMLSQFNRRFDERLRQQAASRGLTVAQVVTLASIIEREAAVPAERALIASVYHNRLTAGMKLDADPTVQYAVAARDLSAAAGYGFWKPELTLDDLKIDSPYNTYRQAGLPPGPICSPGRDSLEAAVAPAETRYLFFVARGDGSHAFSATAEEHEANVRKYR